VIEVNWFPLGFKNQTLRADGEVPEFESLTDVKTKCIPLSAVDSRIKAELLALTAKISRLARWASQFLDSVVTNAGAMRVPQTLASPLCWEEVEGRPALGGLYFTPARHR
jgi:hypothetical protein